MVECAFCRDSIQSLPFKCNRCGKDFCTEHRLPELHECSCMPIWWHNRGRSSVKLAMQQGEIEVIYCQPQTYSEEKDQIPCVLK